MENQITSIFHKLLTDEMDRVFDEEMKLMTQRIEQKRTDLIASLVLRVSKHMDVTALGEKITITINTQYL